MKLWSSSFGIISILVSMLSGMGISGVNESNIQYHVAPDCVSTSDFIENNFQTFVSSYNESVEDSNLLLNATHVESKKSVTNLDDNSQAIYLDFNDDNGYALIGNNYLILDFATTGDLYYLKDVDNLLFTQADGFMKQNLVMLDMILNILVKKIWKTQNLIDFMMDNWLIKEKVQGW
ncbi:MAG: hypothetical protein K2H56_03545 [Malacoplasma sp.]|nr:hypothetical protein [Malacoplasma sp.]